MINGREVYLPRKNCPSTVELKEKEVRLSEMRQVLNKYEVAAGSDLTFELSR